MITVTHLTKKYSGCLAVDDISFTITKGGVWGLLGPNGAGKSTVMNILTGYLAPTDGKVEINGWDVVEQAQKARQSIGYLPEIPPLYPEMTVEEYLLFVAELKGERKKAQRMVQIEQVMEKLGLTAMRYRLIRNLSKGYRQRVGLGGALLGRPEILILDEPTVGLDPAQMIEMRALIRQLGKTHTVILSSHILSEVEAVCDNLLILSQGRVVAQGAPGKIAKKQRLLRVTAQGEEATVLALLSQVKGADNIRVTGKRNGEVSTELICRDGADLRGAVSKALSSGGCPVLAMAEEIPDLEEIFLAVTGTKLSSEEESQ